MNTDEYNRQLIANLHPPDWVNPKPTGRYNLVVIGGGTAGLVTAAGAGLLGAKVAMVEKHLLGGDCTNVGCVPSKAVIRSARAAAAIAEAGAYGVDVPSGTTVNFAAVMERLRRVRADISHNDSAQRFSEEFNVEVHLGEAKFVSDPFGKGNQQAIEVAGQTLPFRKAVIATGARPAIPPVPGLQETGYLTNETVFELTERPSRLAVVGGGYIGCELAQAFQRLGSQVAILQRGDRLLKESDPEAAQLVCHALKQDGVDVMLGASLQQVERQGREKVLHYDLHGTTKTLIVDELLVATGRTPNIEGLNLEAMGVACDRDRGVIVNDFLQTKNPNIYAVGDVCMAWKFTHAAHAAARLAIQNALFAPLGIGRQRLSKLIMPSCTFTDPEVAQVGISQKEIQAMGRNLQTYHVPLSKVDRAVIDGETEGFAKLYVKRGTGKILGATLVGRHAGEMIGEVTMAIENGVNLAKLATTIHPYPTQAEVIQHAADEYSMKQLDSLKPITNLLMKWTR